MSKRTIFTLLSLLAITAALFLLLNRPASNSSDNELVTPAAAPDTTVEEIIFLPDTTYIAKGKIDYVVEIKDSTGNAQLSDVNDAYTTHSGIYTFRGTASRNTTMCGKITGAPSTITIDWEFKTKFDTTKTPYGTWGGGTGWTGQPLYVKWDTTSASSFTGEEIISGSLCGNVYFIDFNTGKQTREPFYAGNTVKGTPSLDPALNGNLYIGQGIPVNKPFGCLGYNIFSQQQLFFQGQDSGVWRGWNAFDSSPVVAGGFLFWPGENGTIYKFSLQNGEVKLHSLLRYRVKDKKSLGIESGMAVWKNYGYFGDNAGNILCINLNNLQPVWCYDNHDDTDATVVVEVEDGMPYIYTGCEVDKQGDVGFSYFTKLNGLTGENVWTQKVTCRQVITPEKSLNGGMFSTPVSGVGDCSHLIFSNFCTHYSATQGLFAFDKRNGEIIYNTKLKAYSWSSPVALLDEKGEMYIFTGDVAGNVYLIKGSTGTVVLTKKVGSNFESSPIVVGNSIVMGSRGNTIYKLSIE